MELTIRFRSGDELRVQVTPETATTLKNAMFDPEKIVRFYQSNGRLLCFKLADVLYIA